MYYRSGRALTAQAAGPAYAVNAARPKPGIVHRIKFKLLGSRSNYFPHPQPLHPIPLS